MKPVRFLLAGLVCALGLALLTVDAQVYPPGYSINPYTGKPGPGPAAYNPYTGKGAPSAQHNPLTGTAAGPAINPLTGKPASISSNFNPLTGLHQPGAGAGATPSGQVASWPAADMPITGKAGPDLEPLDKVVLNMMNRHGVPGAALAVAKDGKLVYAKGFGWADLAASLPVNPLTLFGLASLSKPLTALAALLLIENGQLSLDDRVFAILSDIKAPPGAKANPLLQKITVRQLLNHSGGWDRAKSGDPTNWSPQIAQALKVPQPLTDEQFISFMLTQGLDFEPGTEHHYSNVGYILLGKIIEKKSGQKYEDFVRKHVLAAAGVGVNHAFVNEGHRAYQSNEARRYLAGTNVLLPPMDLPMVRAAGGWTTTAVDMVRVLTALDGSRGKGLLKNKTMVEMLAPPPAPMKPRADGSYPGLGWPTVTLSKEGEFSYLHDGQFHGMRTFLKRLPTGVNWVLLFNVSMQPDQQDAQVGKLAVQEVREHVEKLGQYPAVDLFKEFP